MSFWWQLLPMDTTLLVCPDFTEFCLLNMRVLWTSRGSQQRGSHGSMGLQRHATARLRSEKICVESCLGVGSWRRYPRTMTLTALCGKIGRPHFWTHTRRFDNTNVHLYVRVVDVHLDYLYADCIQIVPMGIFFSSFVSLMCSLMCCCFSGKSRCIADTRYRAAWWDSVSSSSAWSSDWTRRPLSSTCSRNR